MIVDSADGSAIFVWRAMNSARVPALTRVIVQARTDSARLPGKALLPIVGMPSAILAAKRAANTGLQVVLATSDRDIDDQLARLGVAAGLNVFRGNTENVRARFLAASADLPDGSAVIRLTADNMLPDGLLVEQQLAIFLQSGREYQNVEMVWRDPPYGLSAEIMRLGALRSLASRVDSPVDREHVTASLRLASQSNSRLDTPFSAKESAVRCTMDTFDDYGRLIRVFKDVSSPLNVGWRDLLTRFTDLPDAPPGIGEGPKLVLGTAQLATPYGSASIVRPPDPADGIRLVRRAISIGAIAVDTARDYAGSEVLIGDALAGGWNNRISVITKLSPLVKLRPGTTASEAAAAAEVSVLRSLHALGGKTNPLLMLHRASHLFDWSGALWERLIQMRDEGLIAGLGVSVQTPEEAQLSLSDPNVQIVQMPFNLLDWRWADAGIPELLAARPDVTVHVRSVFLQGLLLRSPAAWPRLEGCDPKSILGQLRALAQTLGRRSVADLCVAWVRSHGWIKGLVIGMESLDQLEENAFLFSQERLAPDEASKAREAFAKVPSILLNPALWPGRVDLS
jgi:spore coat polysaccharide biosynthesis protein SpsF (cytidylyltransferase family)/aryl-alcohol dehydrogenase-like predicted oxidoreductase